MPTKQDFEAMAKVIRDSNAFEPAEESKRARLASEVATLYTGQNPRFDREKFIRACMPSWVVGTKAEVHYERVM